MTSVDFTSVTPEAEPIGENAEDSALLRDLIARAKAYIGGFDWCAAIDETYFGDGVGGIFAVVLFRIRPGRPGVDDWLWVVVGDLPSLYLVTDEAPNPEQALRGYVELRDEWVQAVREGRSVEGLAPVNVPATRAWADALDRRRRFIEDKILRPRS